MNGKPQTPLDQVLACLEEVQRGLGVEEAVGPHTRFANCVDSMGLVEFLALLGARLGVDPGVIEAAAGHRFGTVQELADQLAPAGLTATGSNPAPAAPFTVPVQEQQPMCWLSPAVVRLPGRVQQAEELNELVQRPAGWLQLHAGIERRHVWGEEEAIAVAVAAARDCLQRNACSVKDVGALLVAAEAPPRALGLAAAVHSSLGLPRQAPAMEVGGACCGSLHALVPARALVSQTAAVLIVCVEAPSLHLAVRPGLAGESAVLFGDGAAACLVSQCALSPDAVPVRDLAFDTDGSGPDLVCVHNVVDRGVEVVLQGGRLALRALAGMELLAHLLLDRHRLTVAGLAGVVVHGGNGRMVDVHARKLALPRERVWSTTGCTGNLGSASLPAAWAAHGPTAGPVLWLAVAPGFTWAAALTGAVSQPPPAPG